MTGLFDTSQPTVDANSSFTVDRDVCIIPLNIVAIQVDRTSTDEKQAVA